VLEKRGHPVIGKSVGITVVGYATKWTETDLKMAVKLFWCICVQIASRFVIIFLISCLKLMIAAVMHIHQ